MSHRFKQPKTFLRHGSGAARLRKSLENTIKSQQDLDVFLEGLPEQMRDIALERATPYLKFKPMQDLVVPPAQIEGPDDAVSGPQEGAANG
jgi:hypothetical protein